MKVNVAYMSLFQRETAVKRPVKENNAPLTPKFIERTPGKEYRVAHDMQEWVIFI